MAAHLPTGCWHRGAPWPTVPGLRRRVATMHQRRPTRVCPHFGNGSAPAPSHSHFALCSLSLSPHSLEQQQRQRLSSSTAAPFVAMFRRSHRTTHRFLAPRAPPPHAPRYRPARHANRLKVRPNRVFLQRRRRHRAPWPPASLSRRSSGRATLTTACASSSGVWGYRSGHRRSRCRRVLASQRRAPALSRWHVGSVDRWVPRVSADCASRSGCT